MSESKMAGLQRSRRAVAEDTDDAGRHKLAPKLLNSLLQSQQQIIESASYNPTFTSRLQERSHPDVRKLCEELRLSNTCHARAMKVEQELDKKVTKLQHGLAEKCAENREQREEIESLRELVQLQELKIHGLLKEREVLVSEAMLTFMATGQLKVTKSVSQSLRRQVETSATVEALSRSSLSSLLALGSCDR